MSALVDFVAGLVIGASGSGGVWAGIRWARRRSNSPRPDPVVPSVPPPTEGGALDRPTETFEPGAKVRSGLPSQGATPSKVRPDATGDSAAPAEPPKEQVRLSKRVLVHLLRLGRIGPDDLGHPGATQGGIASTLGAEQSAVSKVLRRLGAAGIVEVRRRHVRGGDRRVNVYTLTGLGETLARDVWSRSRPARPVPVATPAPSGRPPDRAPPVVAEHGTRP